MNSISQPLLTEAMLCPSGHGPCSRDWKPPLLLLFIPLDTRCPRLPGAVGGHTSAGSGLLPQPRAPTHHGQFAGAWESSLSKMGAPGRVWPGDFSVLQVLRTQNISYWKNGVWDLSVQGQKSEGKEAPLGLWQRAGAMHPRTQESLPSFGTPKRRPTTAPPVSLLKHTERNCQQGQTWPSLGLIIWIQVCLLLCGRATEM